MHWIFLPYEPSGDKEIFCYYELTSKKGLSSKKTEIFNFIFLSSSDTPCHYTFILKCVNSYNPLWLIVINPSPLYPRNPFLSGAHQKRRLF